MTWRQSPWKIRYRKERPGAVGVCVGVGCCSRWRRPVLRCVAGNVRVVSHAVGLQHTAAPHAMWVSGAAHTAVLCHTATPHWDQPTQARRDGWSHAPPRTAGMHHLRGMRGRSLSSHKSQHNIQHCQKYTRRPTRAIHGFDPRNYPDEGTERRRGIGPVLPTVLTEVVVDASCVLAPSLRRSTCGQQTLLV